MRVMPTKLLDSLAKQLNAVNTFRTNMIYKLQEIYKG